jgi:hypothetical protein
MADTMDAIVGFLETILSGALASLTVRPRDALKEVGRRLDAQNVKVGLASGQVTDAGGERSFVKERRVYEIGGDVFNRNGAADAYVHLRLNMIERFKGDCAAVPLVRSAYTYWEGDAFWVGIQQEYVPPETTLHAKYMTLRNNIRDAEEFAKRTCGRFFVALKRFQTALWLTHNDLHMCNVYVRSNGTPLLTDFDRCSFCVRSVSIVPETVIAYHNWWYAQAFKATRDTQQMLAEVLGLLDAFSRTTGSLPEGPTTRAFRTLLSGDDKAEINDFTSHVRDPRGVRHVDPATKEVWDHVAAHPRGNVRVLMPNAVTLGVWPRPCSPLDVMDALGEKRKTYDGCNGKASDWDVFEYAERLFPCVEMDTVFCELDWLPRAKRPAGGEWTKTWTFVRVKTFVDVWARYNLSMFWGSPTDAFSAGHESLSAVRRRMLFVHALENLQRIFVLFNDAVARGGPVSKDKDFFVLLHACAIALYGQTPLFSSTMFNDIHNDPGSPRGSATVSYVRTVPNMTTYALVSRDPLAGTSSSFWLDRCCEACSLALLLKQTYMESVEVARERLTHVGSVRRLCGSGAFLRFVTDKVLAPANAKANGKVDMRIATHTCLAAVHPDALYRDKGWTTSEFMHVFEESQLTYDITH